MSSSMNRQKPQAANLKHNKELQRIDSMHMLSISHQMRMIRPLPSSTNPIWAGKLMCANYKRIMPITDSIVKQRKLNNWPKLNLS